MEQMADPGAILITADTQGLAQGFIQVKCLGPLPIKGLAGRREVYEVVGADAARSRLQANMGHGLTRFVGRDPEMDRLGVALGHVRRGAGQVAAVVGEPGVGKSRLHWEFTRSPAVDGCLVLEGRSVSYGKATSYLPVIDLLRSYFGIEARDDRRRIRERVTGKLLSLDDGLRSSLPALLALFDVAGDDDAWQRLDAPQRRQQTLDAIKYLFLRESQEQPLVLLLEDLHWIDSETQVLLDALVDAVPSRRVLLLVNYRPEYTHRWGSKTYYHQVQIAPLQRRRPECSSTRSWEPRRLSIRSRLC
jgi:predicted ATPase